MSNIEKPDFETQIRASGKIFWGWRLTNKVIVWDNDSLTIRMPVQLLSIGQVHVFNFPKLDIHNQQLQFYNRLVFLFFFIFFFFES